MYIQVTKRLHESIGVGVRILLLTSSSSSFFSLFFFPFQAAKALSRFSVKVWDTIDNDFTNTNLAYSCSNTRDLKLVVKINRYNYNISYTKYRSR